MTPSREAVGRLVVCPTPIGNLADVTLRVLSVLDGADVVACEDTRRTRVLLRRHGLSAPLVSFHERNERARARELLARMRDGALVALVSDAGTPLLNDPGFVLVRSCLDAGVPVEVLPGPSAVTTALVASGLPAERFCFVGFLPRAGARTAGASGRARGEAGTDSQHAATALRQLLARGGETIVALESPRRLARTLALIASSEPQRPVAVCRELSKRHEEVRRGSAAELTTHYRHNPPRGEVVLVLGASAAEGVRAEEALAALRELVDAGARARPAAAVVGRLTGMRANELYRRLNAAAG